jgi:ABC-type transporter Mla subunit MlaD
MKGSSEARVGAVVVLALATITGGYFFLRGMGRGGDEYRMLVKDGVANIRAGSDVTLRGVKVGEVREVTLDPQTQDPLLTLAIKRDPPVPLLKGYQYSIRSGSLIGENYVDVRGPYSPEAPRFQPNSDEVITGTAAGSVTDLTTQVAGISKDFSVTLQKLNVTIDRINKGILSYPNQVKLTQALEGVARLTRQASQGFGPQGVKVALGDPAAQRALNETLSNTAAASREASVAARNITGLTRQASTVLNNANRTASGLGTVAGGLRA